MNQNELQQELDKLAWTGRPYHLTEMVTLTGPDPLKIEGCYLVGWHPFAPNFAANTLTTLEVTNETTPAVTVFGAHAGLIGHVFRYPAQTKTGRPKTFPVTISAPMMGAVQNSNVVLRSLTFVGAWSFIHTSGGGQHVIEDIRGQLLGGVGIEIDNAADVVRITSVHLWPSFSTNAELMRWAYWNEDRKGNSRGILLRRVDWPQLDDVFVYGAHVAVQLVGPCDPQIGNLSVDATSVGLDIYTLGEGGCQINNFRFAGNRTHGAWRGIPILGQPADPGSGRPAINRTLQIGNLHLHGDTGDPIWNADPALLQIANSRHE